MRGGERRGGGGGRSECSVDGFTLNTDPFLFHLTHHSALNCPASPSEPASDRDKEKPNAAVAKEMSSLLG